MKRVKKVLLAAFALTVVCGLAFSQGDKEEVTPDSSGPVMDTSGFEWEWMADTSPYEFEMWWAQIWGWVKPSVKWDDSPAVALVEEKTGISIDFQVPVGNQSELLGPMIAAGDLPDTMAITPHNSPYIEQMIDAGLIYSLTDLIDQYAPKMKNIISPAHYRFHASEDGELYKWVSMITDTEVIDAYKSIDYPPTGGSKIAFIRNDILDAFGVADVTTLEGFEEILRFTKTNYPDIEPLGLQNPGGNALLGGLGTHFAPTFGIHPSGLYPHNGRIELIIRDPKWVDYMRWVNGLFREGLITANQLTETSQQYEEKIFSARYGSVVGALFHVANNINLTIKENTGDEGKTYRSVGPVLYNDTPWRVADMQNKGWNAWVIAKSAERPDRIIRFLEYTQTEEGQVDMILGVEGDTWQWVDGKRVMLPSAVGEISTSLEQYVLKHGTIGKWASWARAKYWATYVDDYLIPKGDIRVELWKRLGPYVVDIWSEGFVSLDSSFEVGSDPDVARTKIAESMVETAFALVTAGSDSEFNAIYQDGIAAAERLGAEMVEDALTAEYGKQLELLGK